ncbi:MAG: prolyl oligopeptidase family serine peptidase [Gemmatimonas sp.]|nr:prolyl oligopeptidase family serine peptidase [Gemmatimonas sp.]
MVQPRLRSGRLLSPVGIVTAIVIIIGFATEVNGQTPQVERDVVYGYKHGMAMVYDVVRPQANPNGAGVIFVISGGFLSSRENQEYVWPVAQPLLDAGFTIFQLRHPSTPVYLAPEIYEAVREGMADVLENASRFGVERDRIGVMGMSTGGLLALMLGSDHPASDLPSARDRPSAVVAYMPIVDIREFVGSSATPSLSFDPALAPTLSPVDFVTPDDPPTLFIHGERDEIVPIAGNSYRMRALLERARVATDLLAVDAGHELFTGEVKEAADSATVSWFEEHLLP